MTAPIKNPLYANEQGVAISTHSMLKTMRRCPKQAQYKYVERLKPKSMSKPLKRGIWFHALMEAYYKGEDWREVHEQLTREFGQLFEEERERLGDLPREIKNMMLSYLWHYKEDEWKVHEVEFTLEATLPDGAIYRGRVDMLIENQYGLWIVDHKTHARLPDLTFRLLDAQSALYIWAAGVNKIPVQGHIWNYVRAKAPTKPQLLKAGDRISKKAIDTDYRTFVLALREYGLDPQDYAAKVNQLRRQRYRPGEMQTSTFFRRDILEKSPAMIKKVVQEAFHTHRNMHNYPWDRTEHVERVVDRSCTFFCSYTDLCTVELFGGNPDQVRRSQFIVGDPLDYYQDAEAKTENLSS